MQSNPELKIDWPSFIDWFNKTLKQTGSAIREIKAITRGKKFQCQRLVNELGSKKLFIEAIMKMMTSDFCNGRIKTVKRPKGWVASFTWLLSSDEVISNLLNGYYDEPPEQELTTEEQRQLEREAYARKQEERRLEAKAIEEEAREESRQRRLQAEAEVNAIRQQGKTPFMKYYEELQVKAAEGDRDAAEKVLQHEAMYKEHCRMMKAHPRPEEGRRE